MVENLPDSEMQAKQSETVTEVLENNEEKEQLQKLQD